MKIINHKWVLMILLSVFVLSCKKDSETPIASSNSANGSGGGGGGSGSGSISKTTAPEGTALGNAAYNFTGTDVMTGNSFTLNSTLGKYTIIDVWGINCPNCELVSPTFLELLSNPTYAGKLTLVGLACYNGTQPNTNNMLAEANKVKMNNYPQLNDGNSAITSRLYSNSSGSFSLPLVILVDPSGKIVYQGTGYGTGSEIKTYLKNNLK